MSATRKLSRNGVHREATCVTFTVGIRPSRHSRKRKTQSVQKLQSQATRGSRRYPRSPGTPKGTQANRVLNHPQCNNLPTTGSKSEHKVTDASLTHLAIGFAVAEGMSGGCRARKEIKSGAARDFAGRKGTVASTRTGRALVVPYWRFVPAAYNGDQGSTGCREPPRPPNPHMR